MKLSRAVFTACLLTAFALSAVSAQTSAQTPTEICESVGEVESAVTNTFEQPDTVLEDGVDYRVIFCTSAGAVYIDLFEEFTPVTVNSFLFLAEQGYYNNTTFHRVIQDFMVQGGDPTATGSGGPGYQFDDEFVPFLTFDVPGWLAMANAGRGTNGSQFFITTVPTPHLNFAHTIFGKVLEGTEAVSSIQLRDPMTATEPGTLLNTVVIVTDPSAVLTTYESPAKASIEEVTTAFESIAEAIPAQIIEVDNDISGVFSTDEVVAAAPQAIQADLGTYFETHNHLFRATSQINSMSCGGESEPFFDSISYTIDVYETADDADAALHDPQLISLTQADGFTEISEPDDIADTMFTQTISACDSDEGIRALTRWQRGRFVVTVQASLPPGLGVDPEFILTGSVGQIYEQLIASILRQELL